MGTLGQTVSAAASSDLATFTGILQTGPVALPERVIIFYN